MPAVADLNDIAFKRHADELRGTWQARVLLAGMRAVNGVVIPNNALGAVTASVLAHNFDEALPVLLTVCFPGYSGLGTPLLCSAAKIARTGHVMADMIRRDGQRTKNQAFFQSTRAMEKAFRALADQLKFDDGDRVALIGAVKRWVVCDYRLDPTMDPKDPDAKRLTEDAPQARLH